MRELVLPPLHFIPWLPEYERANNCFPQGHTRAAPSSSHTFPHIRACKLAFTRLPSSIEQPRARILELVVVGWLRPIKTPSSFHHISSPLSSSIRLSESLAFFFSISLRSSVRKRKQMAVVKNLNSWGNKGEERGRNRNDSFLHKCFQFQPWEWRFSQWRSLFIWDGIHPYGTTVLWQSIVKFIEH